VWFKVLAAMRMKSLGVCRHVAWCESVRRLGLPYISIARKEDISHISTINKEDIKVVEILLNKVPLNVSHGYKSQKQIFLSMFSLEFKFLRISARKFPRPSEGRLLNS
jgi:hypothetical protein